MCNWCSDHAGLGLSAFSPEQLRNRFLCACMLVHNHQSVRLRSVTEEPIKEHQISKASVTEKMCT